MSALHPAPSTIASYAAPPFPRMSFGRAVRSELIRLRGSSLPGLHLACALVAAVACGLYFSFAPWDAYLGTDAYVQLLGATMPLMVGIVCALDVDAEREASGLANLLGLPSRRIALAAKVVALWLMGVAAIAIAVGVYGALLATLGDAAISVGVYARAVAGMALGSVVLYVVSVALALAFGRNVTIAVGMFGLMLALFAVGGLAHGLMTGELTAASSGVFGLMPFAWAERLGSLGVELAIATDATARAVIVALERSATLAVSVSAAVFVALLVWVGRFEGVGREQ